MKSKKPTILSIILVLIVIAFKGCLHKGINFEIAQFKEHGYTTYDFLYSEDLKEYRIDEAFVNPHIVSDGYGNYVPKILVYSPQKDKEIIVKEAYLKTYDGKNLINEDNLNLKISTNIEIEGGYRGSDIIPRFSKKSVESGTKVFLMLSVESSTGEVKQMEYTINTVGYIYPNFPT